MNKKLLIIGLVSILVSGNTIASTSSKQTDKVETSSSKEKKTNEGNRSVENEIFD